MVRRVEDPRALAGQRVLVRSDLNVPIDERGKITDPGRIIASAPTIRALAEAGAKVIVTAHLGRPKGAPDPQYSLEPVVAPLSRAIGREVAFHAGTVAEAGPAVEALAPGEVLLLENIRFDPRETSKDESERAGLARELAGLADAFVSDGFGVVHRKQASVYDVAALLPSYAGALVVREVEVADRLLHDPVRPYVVVLGGSKVSDKLGVIDSLLDRADALVIGGGMVFTFLAAQGHAVGASLLESDQIPTVQEYLRRAEASGVRIELPEDIVMAASFAADAEHWDVPVDALESTPAGASALGLDIGPKSAQRFAGIIAEAGTVFWNGPMGVFEFPAFAQGTRAVAQALAGHSTESLTVVGGGDSAAAVRALGFDDDQFGHISTGGGASLEYLEGKDLPGLDVLKER